MSPLLALLALYISAGMGLAAWCARNHPDDAGLRESLYLVLAWPVPAWAGLRAWIASLEEALLKWALGFVSRRLVRKGFRLRVE